MAGQLQHLRSSTANKRPTASGLIDGRIAINTASGSPGLFFKDNAGTVVKVGPVHVGSTAPNASPASGGSSGNSIGEQWLDNSGGNYVFKIWDGSAWRSETGEFVNASGDTMTGDLVMNDANIVFEGSTEDGFETTLTVVNPTADRTITFPNVTGTVVTTGDSGTVTSTMIADGTIVNADINSSAAIALSKIATGALPSGITVASANIVDGTIVNADINSSAEIAVSKLADGAARQLLQTDAAGTGVEWTSNVDIPGTLDVTGATTLDSTLDVTGLISADGKVSFPLGTAAAPSLYPGSDTDTGIYSPGANQLAISTNGTEHLRITSDGKLGIGDTAPSETLTVKGASSVDPFSVSGPSSEFLRVDDNGRLLVGTSSALTLETAAPSFQVVGDSAASGYGSIVRTNGQARFAIARGSSGNLATSTIGEFSFQGYDGSAYLSAASIKGEVDGTPGANDMPGRLVFSTTADGASSPTERMRITSDGYVLFFTTSVAIADDGIKLIDSGQIRVSNTDNNALFLNRNGTDGSVASFRKGDTPVGNITVDASSTTYATSSDYRLKENVVPLTGAADRLSQLQVHRFNFIADPDTTVDGFIAHEAQAVVPECVTGTKDEVDDEGNPVYQGIDQSKIVPLVVAALQEALAEIETLKTRLADAGIS